MDVAESMQVYKCEVCGNIVEVLHLGKGELVCCGKAMSLLKENSVDASRERHVPVIEKAGEEVMVKVGSVQHPMEENHYIEWIEVISGGDVCRKTLKPGEPPEAKFTASSDRAEARAYCNLHGLWRA